MAADAWCAHIAECAAPQQWNALLSVFFLNNCRARTAQECAPKCSPSLRRRAFSQRAAAHFRNARAPRVDHHMYGGRHT
eukprot:8097777-Lingulodinium_polyedra.AAC.1